MSEITSPYNKLHLTPSPTIQLSDCKTVNTTMEVKLKVNKGQVSIISQVLYQQLTGSFMYLSVLTKPDMIYKLKCKALSSTESEYVSVSEACRELMYLINLQYEVSNKMYIIGIFNDNQGARKLCPSPIFHKRTKHIDID